MTLDQLGQLECGFLRLVPLAQWKNTGGTPAALAAPSGQPVDPAVWWNVQGKQTLGTCIADLRSKGYSALVIKDNGDVCVQQADKEVSYANLQHFPEKSLWPGLAEVLKRAGLNASLSDAGIAVAL